MPGSTRCCRRSNCGSRSTSPRRDSAEEFVMGRGARPVPAKKPSDLGDLLPSHDIVCADTPLYKARRGRTFPSAKHETGGALEKLKNYRPSEKEPFMNERQRDYFRAKLLAWKDEILKESRITLQTLQEENVNHPDLADRASSETDRAIELRARDRQRKLISKI